MNFFVGILIGLIAGWIIEWVIDWLFWRRDEQDPQLQEKLRRAETEVGQLRTQLDESQAIMADAELTIEELRKQLDELAQQAPQREDRLERVKGIGAVFGSKLKAAGIHTYAQLAELTPERVIQIIQPEEWQKIEAEDWIAQARELAKQQAAKATN
jgi:predicted flap endonuclease-1-like 5' DNA nuclease